MSQELEGFKRSELACACCGAIEISEVLMSRLAKAREIYGRPMRILNGYRCELQNRQMGGVFDSYHCQGMAADIEVVDSRDRFELLTALIQSGFNRIGLYASGFIHVDVGDYPENVVWVE